MIKTPIKLGFFVFNKFNIYNMIDLAVCNNPWCKATFQYDTENDMTVVIVDHRESIINDLLDECEKIPPTECPKCKSFNSELSGGITWKTKEYEGSRFDGTPHEMRHIINKYF